ncbi:hypothetical protein AAHA92_06956 [Salvia divinorum]|uniref:TF-B3 domain-containing protein n=1 Tax=Salvia divinorum TaxID=28513 RepID=A0ABD1I7D5_SALDI
MEDGMESDEPLLLDIDTLEEYKPSSESETDTDEDYTSDRRALARDEKPSFRVVIAECHIERTLEIPIGFWRQHIRKSPVEAEVYFTTDVGTWLVELDRNETKFWVRKGWTRFRHKNNLVKGVRCTFQLVDVDEVHFYAHFDR